MANCTRTSASSCPARASLPSRASWRPNWTGCALSSPVRPASCWRLPRDPPGLPTLLIPQRRRDQSAAFRDRFVGGGLQFRTVGVELAENAAVDDDEARSGSPRDL